MKVKISVEELKSYDVATRNILKKKFFDSCDLEDVLCAASGYSDYYQSYELCNLPPLDFEELFKLAEEEMKVKSFRFSLYKLSGNINLLETGEEKEKYKKRYQELTGYEVDDTAKISEYEYGKENYEKLCQKYSYHGFFKMKTRNNFYIDIQKYSHDIFVYYFQIKNNKLVRKTLKKEIMDLLPIKEFVMEEVLSKLEKISIEIA